MTDSTGGTNGADSTGTRASQSDSHAAPTFVNYVRSFQATHGSPQTQTLRMVVVHIDYKLASAHPGMSRATFTTCDAITGLVMRIVVPSKEVGHDHGAALENFL